MFWKDREWKIILSNTGEAANRCWQEIPKHYSNVRLDKYVIMPNHVHGIIIVDNDDMVGNKHTYPAQNSVGNKNICSLQWQTRLSGSLSSIMRGFKIGVTKWCGENDNYDFHWQKSFFDHVIRNEKSLEKIREYIINNPSKWELDRNNSENIFM